MNAMKRIPIRIGDSQDQTGHIPMMMKTKTRMPTIVANGTRRGHNTSQSEVFSVRGNRRKTIM